MPKRLTDQKRLALHMDERRLDLDLRWADVAERAGVSTEALRTARHGPGGISALTRRGIERALEWEAGSVSRILAGGEPAPIDVEIIDRRAPATIDRVELYRLVDRLRDADLDRVHGYLTGVVEQAQHA